MYEYNYIAATGEFLNSTEYEAGVEKQRANIDERDEYGKVKRMTYTFDGSDAQTYGYKYLPKLNAITEMTLPNDAKES